MNVKITPSKLFGEIDAISSKSDVHRLIIAAALSDKETKIYLNILSRDIKATCSAVQALGAKVQFGEGFLNLIPANGSFSPKSSIDCDESGSTLRFILPLAAALCDEFRITGGGRLPQRPVDILTKEMKTHGVSFISEQIPITGNGRLAGGEYKIPGNISSQYITALLLTLPILKEDSKITLLSPLESSGYVDMTLRTLSLFGIEIEKIQNGFLIKGGQKYRSPGEIRAEGDWSNAAFFIGANFLGADIKVNGLSDTSFQKDREITDILSGLKDGSVIDGADIPDIVLPIAVCACKIRGSVRIENIKRLRLKESDRIASAEKMIRSLGGKTETDENSITVFGNGELSGGEADGENDHRVVMSLAIASLICKNSVLIKGAEAVDKSYPGFFEDFNRLGGRADVVNVRE